MRSSWNPLVCSAQSSAEGRPHGGCSSSQGLREQNGAVSGLGSGKGSSLIGWSGTEQALMAAIMAPIFSDIGFTFWLVPCETRRWTRWSLWVSFHLRIFYDSLKGFQELTKSGLRDSFAILPFGIVIYINLVRKQYLPLICQDLVWVSLPMQ